MRNKCEAESRAVRGHLLLGPVIGVAYSLRGRLLDTFEQSWFSLLCPWQTTRTPQNLYVVQA